MGQAACSLGKDRIFIQVSVGKFFDVWVGELAQLENVDYHTVFWGAPHEQLERPVVVVGLFPNREAMACVKFKWDDDGCVQASIPFF